MLTNVLTTGVDVSIVIPVLQSHEVSRRQCLYFDRTLPDRFELILVDDGSNPPIQTPRVSIPLTVTYSRDTRPWTQALAAVRGARIARHYLLMTDVDHILSQDALAAVGTFRGFRMTFPRLFGELSADGEVRPCGSTDINAQILSHQNTFVIQRRIFLEDLHGEYDEDKYSRGVYGGDDVDFNRRYYRLVQEKRLEPDADWPTDICLPCPGKQSAFSQSHEESDQCAIRMLPEQLSIRNSWPYRKLLCPAEKSPMRPHRFRPRPMYLHINSSSLALYSPSHSASKMSKCLDQVAQSLRSQTSSTRPNTSTPPQ